jgi:hypothetical protein
MLGIFPARRQLWIVRRETGNRRRNSGSSMKAANFVFPVAASGVVSA